VKLKFGLTDHFFKAYQSFGHISSVKVSYFDVGTAIPVLSVCPLFHEFRDIGDFTQIMSHEYIF